MQRKLRKSATKWETNLSDHICMILKRKRQREQKKKDVSTTKQNGRRGVKDNVNQVFFFFGKEKCKKG